jgi:hypothetical protein
MNTVYSIRIKIGEFVSLHRSVLHAAVAGSQVDACHYLCCNWFCMEYRQFIKISFGAILKA